MAKDYMPRTDSQFIFWFENFITKLGTHGATVGVTPAQITQLQTDPASCNEALSQVQALKTQVQSAVEDKDDAFTSAQKRLRDTIVVLKRHADYTVAIGEDIGVVPPEQGQGPPVNINDAKPEFRITLLPDMVRLEWVKGNFDGVAVQSKRGGESAFTTLGRDSHSPFDDSRANLTPDAPETRIYRLRYVLKDNEVGQWSDEVSAVVLI